MTTPTELVTSWRGDAARLEAWGAVGQAITLRHAADELDAALRAEHDTALTIAQAAEESGYSADHLTRQIRAGKIPNAGRPHAPRILRAHLPRKPRVANSTPAPYDPDADAAFLLTGRLPSNGGAHGR